jgi:lysophospholipase L1-like esterase
MINDIKEVAGDRAIYIQLILPVTRGFETSKYMNPFGIKNSNVPRFNAELIEIAKECKVYYFDCSDNFLLDDGTLDPYKSSDGAHLTLDAYAEQLEFYKSHVVNRAEYAW